MHRSPECKRVFERALEIAVGGEVTCLDLFVAILEHPGTIISSTLEQFGINVSQLLTLTLNYQKEIHELRDKIRHSLKEKILKKAKPPISINLVET